MNGDLKQISLEGMVDVCAGPMTIEYLTEEINWYFREYKPGRMFTMTIPNDGGSGYYSVIYIDKESFEKRK